MNYLGLEKENIQQTADQLNLLLANYHIYYQNLRNFHWNISGRNFFDLHEKFEQLYDDAKLKIDEIAERLLTLRFKPLSLISEYLSKSEIEEAADNLNDTAMIQTILSNHQILIKNMRKLLDVASEAGDEGTIDMIGSFMENLEKVSWMLDAWSER